VKTHLLTSYVPVAYKENVKTDEDRQRGSDGWKKYYGFRIRLDQMCCDGCPTPDGENPVLLAPNCTIPKCAIINGVETYAHCSGFQAYMLDLRIFSPDINREKVELHKAYCQKVALNLILRLA